MKCEAITITSPTAEGDKSHPKGWLRGTRKVQCNSEAVHRHEGVNLCWVHWTAARNTNRLRPLEFVDRKVKVR